MRTGVIRPMEMRTTHEFPKNTGPALKNLRFKKGEENSQES